MGVTRERLREIVKEEFQAVMLEFKRPMKEYNAEKAGFKANPGGFQPTGWNNSNNVDVPTTGFQPIPMKE